MIFSFWYFGDRKRVKGRRRGERVRNYERPNMSPRRHSKSPPGFQLSLQPTHTHILICAFFLMPPPLLFSSLSLSHVSICMFKGQRDARLKRPDDSSNEYHLFFFFVVSFTRASVPQKAHKRSCEVKKFLIKNFYEELQYIIRLLLWSFWGFVLGKKKFNSRKDWKKKQ